MITRRLGRAAWLSQGHGSSSSSTIARVTISTWNNQRQTCPSLSRSVVSSSLQGAFVPTQVRAAAKKKKSVASSAEETIEEDVEEEALFAISDAKESKAIESSKGKSQIPITGANVNAATIERVPFEQGRQSLLEKLEQYEEDPRHTQRLQKSDWNLLARSVTNIEQLRSCLELAKKWNTLTYAHKTGLSRFNEEQTRFFIDCCSRLRCPELALDAVLDRGSTGLDFDLKILQHLQHSFTKKLLTKNFLLARTSNGRSAEIESEGLESIQTDHSTISANVDDDVQGKEDSIPKKDGETIPEKINKNELLLQARLTIIDRTLAMVATTSIFFSDRLKIDTLTLLLSIEGMIRLTNYIRNVKGNEEFSKSQIQPRMFRAIEILYNDKVTSSYPDNMVYRGDWVDRSCRKLAEFLISNRYFVEEELRITISQIIDRLFKIVSQCGPERLEEFKEYVREQKAEAM